MSLSSLCSQHTIRVDKRSETRGAAGSAAYTWPAGTEYNGYKRELSSTEVLENASRGYQASERVYFATEPDVDNEDRLVVDGLTLIARGRLVHQRCGRLEFWYIDCQEPEVV